MSSRVRGWDLESLLVRYINRDVSGQVLDGFKANIYIFYISRERMRRSLSPLKRACPLPRLTVLLLVRHVGGNAMAATAMLPHLLLLFLARDYWCLLVTGLSRRLAKSLGILL